MDPIALSWPTEVIIWKPREKQGKRLAEGGGFRMVLCPEFEMGYSFKPTTKMATNNFGAQGNESHKDAATRL
jgi:hypothetical protein